MRFLSAEACRTWAVGCGYRPDAAGLPVRLPVRQPPRDGGDTAEWRTLGFDLAFTQTYAFARAIVATLPSFTDDCLVWLTEWGIWPSSENLHLYYRLRQSYREPTLLHEAPGHLFLGYERADLTSFVQLAVLFGWGFHVLPSPAYHTLFVSHDEYVVVSADDAGTVGSVVETLMPYCKSPPVKAGEEEQPG